MKNNCDVTGKRTYCKHPPYDSIRWYVECDYQDKTDETLCTYKSKDGSCSNLAAIRAAIEAEKEETK